MKKLKKIRDATFFVLFLCPVIILALLFFGTLELLGVIKIHGRKNIPKYKEGLILATNHPSFYEPMVLGYVFIKYIIKNPIKNFPYSCPDFTNFNKWYWTTMKERFIFFPRGNKRKCAIALARAVRLLKRNRIVIIHPEGGRTSTNKTSEWHIAENGCRLRPLQPGAIHLALRTNCHILPGWVKGAEKAMPRGSKLPYFWKKIEIFLGEPFRLKGEDTKENLEKGKKIIVEKILALSKKDD